MYQCFKDSDDLLHFRESGGADKAVCPYGFDMPFEEGSKEAGELLRRRPSAPIENGMECPCGGFIVDPAVLRAIPSATGGMGPRADLARDSDKTARVVRRFLVRRHPILGSREHKILTDAIARAVTRSASSLSSLEMEIEFYVDDLIEGLRKRDDDNHRAEALLQALEDEAWRLAS
jgi:hypothetical protein